ncbi:MAG: sigma-70 family RNA polymerase sigma factor, partial [Planctomycetota bacterium]
MSRKPTLASLPPSTATSREHRLLAEADFVRRTARALLRDAAEAEDLAQDTLLIALSRPPRALSRAWLRRVLWTRATRRYAPPAATGREELLGSLAARGRGPETDASRVEACEALHDALARLAPDQRELIRLLYFEGLTARTAARRLGIPHETVRTRRRAALARLRRRVETRERGARLSLGLFLLARPWRAAGRNAWAGGFLAAAVAITALAAGLSGMLGRAGHGAPTRPDDP